MDERDPWNARTTSCPEVIPADLGPNSLERYKSATSGGAIRAGDSYDIGASMWDEEEGQETTLGQGCMSTTALQQAAEEAKTGAFHGYQDWPMFSSGDVTKTEPEGLPDFRKGKPTGEGNPLIEKDPVALLVEYNKPGRELEDRLMPSGNRFSGYYQVCILHVDPQSQLRAKFKTSYILVCWLQQFGDDDGYVIGWAIADYNFINMVAHGIPHVDFDFANNMWQAWNNGGLWGAWGQWYDDDEEEWEEDDNWNGHNVGGPHFVAVADEGQNTFMEYPDDWLQAQGMVNVGNPHADWPDFVWNWDTITEAPTSVPYTVLGDASVHTAPSAVSAAGTVVEEDDAASVMEVDSEAAGSQQPVQPIGPNQSEDHGSYRSRLLGPSSSGRGSRPHSR